MHAPIGRAIEARHVAVVHGRGARAVRALDGVSLAVRPGEHLAVLGPSGGGKSTLIAVLAGTLRPDEGEVQRWGRVARVHQDLRLVPRASARANVLHGALHAMGLAESLNPPRRLVRRAEALLARVGLAHRAHAPVRTLSGGEAQRVAIARALMHEPDILLADEPVASLDPASAHAIMALLDELRRERGLTLVSVLHDRALADAHADRIVELADGRLAGAAIPVPTPAPGLPPPVAAAPPRAAADMPARAAPLHAGWIAAGFAVAFLASIGVVADGAMRTDNALAEALRMLARLVPTADELALVDWRTLGGSLVDTLRMSIVGTTASALLALPLAALAARNVAPPLVGLPVRVLLNVWRAVPSLVWAVLFVAAVGLGAMAGVIALIAYSMGYLTKFFYEALEGADGSTGQALDELGASGLQRFVHALWPVAMPALAGSALFMLEYNVRAASVLGLVGAGGIGHHLKLAVDWANWHEVGIILAMLAATVIAVDALSAAMRRRIA